MLDSNALMELQDPDNLVLSVKFKNNRGSGGYGFH